MKGVGGRLDEIGPVARDGAAGRASEGMVTRLHSTAASGAGGLLLCSAANEEVCVGFSVEGGPVSSPRDMIIGMRWQLWT